MVPLPNHHRAYCSLAVLFMLEQEKEKIANAIFAQIMSRFVHDKVKLDNKRDIIMMLIEKLRMWLITQT